MRDIIERFLVLPFSMGCVSKSTTGAIESTQCKDQNLQPKQLVTRIQDGKSSGGIRIKNSWKFVTLKRSNISRGIHRLILDTFQSFSRIINYKDAEEMEMEMELEIGFPTDVKHVTHIGYDGTMTTNPIKDWDNIEKPEILSISMKQFEDAMAAQAETPLPS
ncbi:CRIB domain-containing protein RIC4-like [Rutidosis leptorrhynchoides]|uniref:CRIB domain-containing protein RIC4-like n=1 Tax=Rutidosis leptorrhynchoides TaxID=125765 RepID=UPI003A990B79